MTNTLRASYPCLAGLTAARAEDVLIRALGLLARQREIQPGISAGAVLAAVDEYLTDYKMAGHRPSAAVDAAAAHVRRQELRRQEAQRPRPDVVVPVEGAPH